jgi:hypothetical protein
MNFFETPSILQEGVGVYQKFVRESVPHKKGFFIVAPSGAGKTYFVTRQEEKNWIDGDTLWIAGGAFPGDLWWTGGLEVIKEVEARCDVITSEAKRQGLWVIGASNNWLVPDAVVLPPLAINIAYIKSREENNYDGGLTSKNLKQLKAHRKEIKQLAKKRKVPIFTSVQAATDHIAHLYEKLNN